MVKIFYFFIYLLLYEIMIMKIDKRTQWKCNNIPDSKDFERENF